MESFDIAVSFVLAKEGGLNENPKDKGGITNKGISLRFLKSLSAGELRSYGIFVGYEASEDDIRNLTEEQAINIYKGVFWDNAPFGKIKNQSNLNYIFDMSINMGINPAIKCAQRACWAVMRQKDIIKDDGILGNKTLSMLNHCGIYLLSAMRSERAGYYKLIAEKDETQHTFLEGWLNRAYGG